MLSTHQERQEAAQRLVDVGRYHEAMEQYRRVLVTDPSDVPALLGLGDLYVRLGEQDKALSAYERVAEQYSRAGTRCDADSRDESSCAVSSDLAVLNSLAHAFDRIGATGKACEVRKQAVRIGWRKGATGIFDDPMMPLAVAPPDAPMVDEHLALQVGVTDSEDRVTDVDLPVFDDSTGVTPRLVDERFADIDELVTSEHDAPRGGSAEDLLDRILREAWGASSIDTSPPPAGDD
ncbi:MAG: hypothetical protein DRI90_14430 [Deltaproteobacteria bacterium]|nr:MAG: hypothetical protein DRI90_14430 [Deltaproteobacteria bacterium]